MNIKNRTVQKSSFVNENGTVMNTVVVNETINSVPNNSKPMSSSKNINPETIITFFDSIENGLDNGCLIGSLYNNGILSKVNGKNRWSQLSPEEKMSYVDLNRKISAVKYFYGKPETSTMTAKITLKRNDGESIDSFSKRVVYAAEGLTHLSNLAFAESDAYVKNNKDKTAFFVDKKKKGIVNIAKSLKTVTKKANNNVYFIHAVLPEKSGKITHVDFYICLPLIKIEKELGVKLGYPIQYVDTVIKIGRKVKASEVRFLSHMLEHKHYIGMNEIAGIINKNFE